MDYIEVTLSFNEPVYGEILEAELAEIDFESFENEKNKLKAYIGATSFDEAALNEVLSSYSDSISSFSILKIDHTNWNAVWEASYEPVLIDGSIYVKAPFHDDNLEAETSITLDPNMSFGTGHHPTTHMMLKELKSLDLEGKKLCDFGSGSGILSIYASMKGASGIGIEIDEHAADAARANLTINGVDNFEMVTGDIKDLGSEPFDIIVANINRNVIEESLKEFKVVIKNGARLLCAGFLDADAAGLIQKLNQAGFKIVNTDSREGWTMLSTQYQA